MGATFESLKQRAVVTLCMISHYRNSIKRPRESSESEISVPGSPTQCTEDALGSGENPRDAENVSKRAKAV